MIKKVLKISLCFLALCMSLAATAEVVDEVNAKVPVFGHQLFTGNFALSEFTGFNKDHYISVGDQISVQMWGAYEFTQILEVDAQGNLFLPQVGPVRVLGVRNAELNDVVTKKVKRVFKNNVKIYVNLVTAQPVKIYVTGYVKRPGMYEGLSSDSVLKYIDLAGGIDELRGSFLDIVVKRNNKEVQNINLYDFLITGNLPDVQLQDGDTIVIGPLKNTVTFSGLVKNPFKFEYEAEEFSLEEALVVVGLLPDATHVKITRNQGLERNVEYLSLDSIRGKLFDIRVKNGDEIEVVADKNDVTISVSVNGEHDGAARYILPDGATLGDLKKQLVLNERSMVDGFQLFRSSVARRQQQMLQTSLNSIEANVLTARSATDEEASLRTKEADLILKFVERAKQIKPRGQVVLPGGKFPNNFPLENNDRIIIPAKDMVVMVHGEILFPNAMAFEAGKGYEDYIQLAGGYTQQADKSRVLILRKNGRVINTSTTDEDDVLVKAGDEVFVLPDVDVKSLQVTKDITQVLYQIAISAAVVVGL